MTSPPPPVHLPVPVPQPAESPAAAPARRPFRPRWPAAALLVLWAAAALAIPLMRQQDARAVAGARADGVAAGAAARLDAVVAVIRAAVGENRGAAAFPAVAASLAALAPGDWLGVVRTDAYGAVAESRGAVRPTAAVLRGAVIAARPSVTVETVRDGTADQPVVVVAVPVAGPALVESVIAVVLHPRFWRLDQGGGADEDAALLAPGCVLLAARPMGAVGVTDGNRCRERLGSPGDAARPAGLGRIGEDGPDWAPAVLRPVPARTVPWTAAPWAVAVPVRTEAPAALVLLWGLGPAGVLLLGVHAGLPGVPVRRWMGRRTAGRA